MAIEIDKYLRAKNPPQPLDLFPEEVLKQMLNGFCFYLHAGIAILRPKDGLNFTPNISNTNITLEFDRLETDEVRLSFTKFCSIFRRDNERICCALDARKAAEYWYDPNKGPEKYNCILGLIDMAYPLRLHDKPVAVISAGQIITKYAVPQIKQNLQRIRIVAPQTQEALITLLDDEEALPSNSEAQVESTFAHFKIFGRMLQDLLDRLYNQRWDTAKREFLSDVTRELTLAPTWTLGEWQEILHGILADFPRLTHLDGIKVYSRRQSRFELWGTSPTIDHQKDDDRRVPVKYVAPLPYAQFIPLETLRGALKQPGDFRHFEEILDFPNKNVTLFLHKHQEESNLFLSTLIAVSGSLKDEDTQFIQDFCEIIAMRVELTRLVFTLRDERQRFADRVGRVGHATKTPLQNAISTLADLKKLIMRTKKSAEKVRLIDLCVRNIRIAKLYMRDIYTPPSTKGQRKNIGELLDTALDAIRKISEERQCEIKTKIEPLFDPVVHDQGTLSIVLTNLLDNATKYSNPGGIVTIRLNSFGSDIVLIEVENYGQGIPQSYIEKVTTAYTRWSPINLSDDLRQRRQGTGLGLSMAVEYVESHGGWLEIRSMPKAREYGDDPSDHWKTIVTIGLPISKD